MKNAAHSTPSLEAKGPILYTELCWVLGTIILAFGTALMEKADFGMSMVVAPAYLFHLKLSEICPWFSFGMAEYVLQGVLLLLLGLILGRFRKAYLFSFVTAVVYGFCLDGAMLVAAFLPTEGLVLRILYYLLGMLLGSVGISLFFHTYLCPEAYELVVSEVSRRYHRPISRVKTVYDCISCALSVLLSFLFFGFGHFEGIKWGTVLCALINGTVIGFVSRVLDRTFIFRDRFTWRAFFEKNSPRV